MGSNLCKLTLVYPPKSEDALINFLLDREPAIPGFTTWHGAGHGLGFDSASVGERVEGRVARRLLVVLMNEELAERLIEDIRSALPLPHLIYWTEPVNSAGRLI